MTVEVLREPPSKPMREQLAKLHIEEINEGFMTSLGPRFLQVLYGGLATSAASFVIVARRSDGSIEGFICGSTDTGAAYREVLRRVGLRLAFHAAPRLLSPRNIYRAVETLFYPAQHSEYELPPAELLNFCVSSDSRGRGVGRQLFSEFNNEERRRGVQSVRIVTGATRRRAQEFCRAAGARQVADLEVHSGKASVVFIHDTRSLS